MAKNKQKKRREYSKSMTTIIASVFSTLAVAFVVFVCYEMHRLKDLSPVGWIGSGIVAILATIIGFYMWRAKAKSQTDLEWEKTKQLTLFREKHPEHFTPGKIDPTDFEDYSDGGVG